MNMWHYTRNEYLHGVDLKENRQILRRELQDKVCQLYEHADRKKHSTERWKLQTTNGTETRPKQ